jgi:predicted transposase YdaD
MAEPTQPHDKLFKALMDDPAMAGALIRERLPPDIAELLGPDPPEAMDGSFIDPALRASQSDRLFKVRTSGGDDAYLFLLVEHKSSPDFDLPLQLLGYMVRIWKRHADASPTPVRLLPAILPMVLYHGARAWTVPLSFRQMIAADEAILGRHLDFSYGLTDLGRIDDDRLPGRGGLRAGLLALKYAFKDTDPRPVLAAILALVADEDRLAGPLVSYIVAAFRRVDRPMLIEAIRQAKPNGGDIMVSLAAQEWIEEGRAEGLREGLNQGLREGLNQGLREGLNQGLHDGRARTLLRQLSKRFAPIPDTVRARIDAAGLDELERWLDRVLDAETLAAVFEEDGPA